MTSQQFADAVLARWQELRPGLEPEDVMAIIVEDFWRPPLALDTRYEDTLRRLSDAMLDDEVAA